MMLFKKVLIASCAMVSFANAIAIKTECVVRDVNEVGNTASADPIYDLTSDAVSSLDTTSQLSRAFVCLDNSGNLNSMRMEFTDDSANSAFTS